MNNTLGCPVTVYQMLVFVSFLLFAKHLNFNDINVDLYKIINLDPDTPNRDILKSYKRFQIQKNRQKNPSEKTLRLWGQMELSYSVLTDSSSRKLYDSFGLGLINETGFSVFGYQDDFKIALIQKYYSQQYQVENNDQFGGIITFPLQFQLADFMNGAKKVVKSIQTVPCHCPRGGVKCAKCRKNPFMTQIVEHTIHLHPGTPEFHRILVNDLGDTKTGRGASDVVFIVQSAKHPSFERYKSDLHTNLTVSLSDAIRGGEVEIKNLDDEIIRMPITGIKHGMIKRVKGKGLPIPGMHGKRGDLIITFNIEFPQILSAEQNRVINEILPDDISSYN